MIEFIIQNDLNFNIDLTSFCAFSSAAQKPFSTLLIHQTIIGNLVTNTVLFLIGTQFHIANQLIVVVANLTVFFELLICNNEQHVLDTPGFVLVVKFQAHQRVLTSFGGVTVENRVLDQAGWLFWAGLQKGSNVLRKCQNALKRDSSGIKLSVLFSLIF